MVLSVDWIKHIESWQCSGLSQAEYCRREGLNYRTFTVRLSAYRKPRKAARPSQPSPTALIPVQVEVPLPAEAIRLITDKGQRVELPATVSAVWLAELLRCLA